MPPAIVAAGIGAVGAIGGGLIASHGAGKAAKAQSASDAAAIAEQQRQFDLTRSDFAPYLTAGKQGLGGLSDLLGLNGDPKAQAAITALQSSPEYQSLYSNGLESVLQNASATGGIRGGNTQGALANFGRDTLSQVIGDQIQRLGGIAGLGVNATGSVANFGANASNSISSLLQAQGNAKASGSLANAGIWSGVLNSLGGIGSSLANPGFKGF